MIEVQNLHKVYGETHAVSGISFEVPEGEVLGFLGPNGAGKSTTMRVLTGFTPATSGVVRIGGFDVQKQSRQVRSILGYLPESAPVYGEMTVRAYVEFIAETKGLRGVKRRSATSLALEECGLSDVAGRLLMNLSKGYRQRAAIAQAVVGDPQILIFDEPTVGLDPSQIRDIRDLIRTMAGRRTVILSTHILPEVSLTCTRVLVISQGKVVAQGTPDHLEGRGVAQENRLTALVCGNKPEPIREVLEKIKHLEFAESTVRDKHENRAKPFVEFTIQVEGSHDIRSEVARAILEGGFDLLELKAQSTTLEDIYLRIIATCPSKDPRGAGSNGK